MMELNSATLTPIMNAVLRVPPLFVVDSLFNGYLRHHILEGEGLKMGIQSAQEFHIVILLIVGTSCMVVVLLPKKQLVNFYVLMSLFGTLYTSYICNCILIQNYMHPEISTYLSPIFLNFWIFVNKWTSLERHSSNILALLFLQIFLAKLYSHLKDDFLRTEKWSYCRQKTQPGVYRMYFLFMFPVILVSLPADGPALNFAPIVEVVLALVDMRPIFELLKLRFLEFRMSLPIRLMFLLRNDRILEFSADQWERVQLPTVFRTFFFLHNLSTGVSYLNSTEENLADAGQLFAGLTREMLEGSTRTYLSLVCLASVLSTAAHHVERIFMRWIGVGREESRRLSVSVPVLFFVLAVQTALPVLGKSKRMIRLHYIFSLVFLSCLRHVHAMLHKRLQVTALTSFSIAHIRHLVLSFTIILVTGYFIGYQWQNNVLSTWLLSVLSFGIELAFKVIVSLSIYGFLFVERRANLAGDRADKYAYHITFFGELVEFFLGVFIFCNGVWMMLFESAGVLRVVLMCAHLYFNIWCQAKQLYTTCMKRKEISAKVGGLRSAAAGEVESSEDLCVICYQDLKTGVVKETECKHLFHETCLCKWAPISTKCPICHRNAFDEAPPS